VIRNTGSTPANLQGYRLNAGDPGQDFTFPPSRSNPGQRCASTPTGISRGRSRLGMGARSGTTTGIVGTCTIRVGGKCRSMAISGLAPGDLYNFVSIT
jgi:hypothetical protein